ncbi:MAG: hypothetical protein JXA20_12550 [Spirochaetes bacterium]|nr:hypothetical protein [Spirochaetota bacterium]
MKITIDGILGSADRLRSQRQQEEQGTGANRTQARTDSVTISSRISSRIDTIESEFREIQSSLTKNQIIRDGIAQLQRDTAGGEREQIMERVRFEGEPVLRQFLGENPDAGRLTQRSAENADLINRDADRLRRLQVELDNIVASNLVGEEKLGSLVQNVESSLTKAGIDRVEAISNLQPDTVMRLIR